MAGACGGILPVPCSFPIKRCVMHGTYRSPGLSLLLCCFLLGCARADDGGVTDYRGVRSGAGSGGSSGCGPEVAYPTGSRERFEQLYRGRSFYADGNHLGHDVLLSEGEAVSAVACGTLVVSRAADGYGTLVAVVEHELSPAVRVPNGVGEMVEVHSFLSIYGHLRPSGLREGTHVSAGQVLGYVEHRDRNGDGDEHLHLGIRLQSASDARRSDPTAWFRGYDARAPSVSQRRWFADPAVFLSALRMEGGAGTPPSDAAPMDAGVTPEPHDAAPAGGMPTEPPPPPPPAPTSSETCNGLDDDGDGEVDEDFLCPLGTTGEICVTTCGANGYRLCEAPMCGWGEACYTFPEDCSNTIDDDCNGLVDCLDTACSDRPACSSPEPETPPPPVPDLPTGGESGAHALVIIADLESVAVRNLCHDLAPEIILWDTWGNPWVSGERVERLEYPLGPADVGYLAVNIRCGSRYMLFPDALVGLSATSTGVFTSITLDGRELVDGEVMVCRDPWAPPLEDGTQPNRPLVPLVEAIWWSCP